MVLLIQGDVVQDADPNVLLTKILSNTFIQERARDLQKLKTEVIETKQHGKNLYVFQRERATVKQNQASNWKFIANAKR